MPNYVIVRNKDEKPMEYYRQKTKTFVGSLQSASKWNSKKMAQPAYDKLIKNGEKNLEIVDSDKDKQEVMNMLLSGDENTGSQHAMDALDKIKEVTSPRSYQYRNPKLKQKYSKLLQSKQIKTIEKLFFSNIFLIKILDRTIERMYYKLHKECTFENKVKVRLI